MRDNHYYHFKVRRWLVWTFMGGVLIGAVILANLAAWEESTPAHWRLALAIGAMYWFLIGLVAWNADAFDVSRTPHLPAELRPGKTHPEWEDRARLDAIHARAVAETAEAHPVS